MNIFKRFKLYYQYYKLIKENKDIFNEMGYSIDWFGKLGKLVSIPDGKIPADYLTRKKDIDSFLQSEVNNEVKKIRPVIDALGLNEITKIYKNSRTERFTSELNIGFSLINTDIFGKGVLYTILALLSLTIIIFFINFLISINILLIIANMTTIQWLLTFIVTSILYIFGKNIKNKII